VDDITSDKKVPGKHKSVMPEQDYLTRFYKNEWHHLSVRYNYQPHQISFTDRRGLERCERLKLDYFTEVSIVHFSAIVKPRDLLINPKYAGMSEMKFAEEVLLKQYQKGMYTDRTSAGFSGHRIDVIEAQLRAATRASTGEWFHHWHSLQAQFAELTFLVDVSEALADAPRRSHSRRRGRSRSRRRSPRRGKGSRRGPQKWRSNEGKGSAKCARQGMQE
jgi:lipopolysaccharide biosynthesis glycosyltransferase